MNQKEIEKLREYVEDLFDETGADSSVFDFEKEIDLSLTYEENLTLINGKLKHLIPTDLEQLETNGKYMEEKQRFDKKEKESRENLRKELGMFQEQANVLVLGKKRSGKSCLGLLFMKSFSEYGRDMFVYQHPRPEILKKLPFKVSNITNIKQLSNLTDAVVLVDEAQRSFGVWEKAVNQHLRNILSVSAQNNVCFIFVCHNSFFISRSLFSFIDIKIIKELNDGHFEMERPYMKKLYDDVPVVGIDKFFIDSDYYRGMETFDKPEWYTEELSFSYKNDKERDFFKKFASEKAE